MACEIFSEMNNVLNIANVLSTMLNDTTYFMYQLFSHWNNPTSIILQYVPGCYTSGLEHKLFFLCFKLFFNKKEVFKS